MKPQRLLLVGPGHLGSLVLDLLVRRHPYLHVLVGGRNERSLHERVNLAALMATHLGVSPHVEHTFVDLWDVERTAETIASFQPDIIFNAACLQSWWVISNLPGDLYQRIKKAEVGPWLPVHLALVYNLMQAVQQTGRALHVVNASYPDVVNPVLARAGLAPTVGIGNLANNVPAMRHSIAEKLNVPVDEVEVRMFMHHYVSHRISRHGDSGGGPYYVCALIDGNDVTGLLDDESLFDLLPTRFKRVGGVGGTPMTAASALTVLDAFMNESPSIVHAPAPGGLPGGYAVRINEGKVEVALPPAVTIEEVVGVNIEGQRFDGIQSIDDDGTVHFMPEHMGVMSDCLGYECASLRVDEAAERARELTERYAALARQKPRAVAPVEP